MSAATPARDLVGAVLNRRWRLVRLLGEGGMGAVFEAEGPPGVGKRAIKLLHQEFVTEDLIMARFFTESQATRTWNHPNVAQVLETATAENGTPYLVMDLLEGTPVATYVDQGQALPTAQAVHIAHGVLQALSAAHARGVIHRDIKPDNLFLVRGPSGSVHVKVLDFGIAKVMDVAGGMGQKTRTGVLLGTPGYMSPEQIKNSKGVDGRTDLWAVGVIFYELLAGSSPFPADNDFARLTSVLTEELRPIAQAAPHLAAWTGFFQRALAKDPDQRFQTADEMAGAMLATARGPSLRPPATLQGPPQAVVPVERPSQASFPYAATALPSVPAPRAPAPNLTTPMSALGDSPSGIGPSPVSAQAPRGTPQQRPSAYPPQAVQQRSSAYPPSLATTQAAQEISSITPAPVSAGGYYGVASTSSPYAPVAAVSQPMQPGRSGTIASSPPPELPSHVVGDPGNIGPTHVSAQHPGGPPVMHGYAPSIQVVGAPPVPRRGAAWWVVGVVAVVAFGLGLSLGLVLG